ncbi:MAG TPA: hypothetical protein VHF45_13380 [Thermoleophilaceae bacterium]|nr:hypothetical protein [Thermoleophilaceae bacterium]
MRRGLLVGIVAGVLVGAVLIYLLAVPGRLASDYKERAEPEHERVEQALDPVYDTFGRQTLGWDNRPIEKADGPGEYVRAIEKVTRQHLRDLAPARRAINRAQRTLEDIDEEKLTETPDWPLLGGRGELREAEEIAGREKDYLRKGRRFLKDYRRLIDYEIDQARFYRRVGITIGRGAVRARDADTPSEFSGTVDRNVREVAAQVRRFRKLKAPPERRAEHRNIAATIDFVIGELRRLSNAVRRLDLEAADQVDNRLARGSKPYDRRTQLHFRRLISRSTYVRQIRDLERRQGRIARAYDDL